MAERNGFPLKEGSRGSIVLREQDGRYRPVCFRDEPKLRPVHGLIGGNDPPALCQCSVVGRTVVVCEVSPIAGLVALNPCEDVILCEGMQGIRRCDNAAESEYSPEICRCRMAPPARVLLAPRLNRRVRAPPNRVIMPPEASLVSPHGRSLSSCPGLYPLAAGRPIWGR